jgi:hypothetical protein
LKIDNNCYFPVKEFVNEKTYVYTNQNDTTETAIWKMKTTILNNDTLLQTTILDNQNRIIDLMVENVINGNSKIITYFIYDYDKQGTEFVSNCTILDSTVFKVNQVMGENIKWSVTYKSYLSDNLCKLTKVRTLKENDTNQKTFYDQMTLTSDGLQTYNYSVVSVYQKDKGLISYKVTLPDGKVKDFKLIKTI